MNKTLLYTLCESDLEKTAGGLVNLVLKNCVRVTGHETSRAKYEPFGIAVRVDKAKEAAETDEIQKPHEQMRDEGGVLWRQIRVSERMRVGETLRVILPEDADTVKILPAYGAMPDGSTLHILYEDDDLILIDKPAGVVVHPSPGHYADTIANYLAGYFAERGEAIACRIVGRLDKETSGVLAFAKNRASAARLSGQRARDDMRRTYYAIVKGHFAERDKNGVIDTAQESTPGVLMIRRIAKEGEGMAACTHYEVLAQSDDAALVTLHIDTGRTHQIRLHMASIGHPLIGDTLYGEDAAAVSEDGHVKSMAEGEERAMLHAGSLRMIQPFTGEALFIESPMPDDFKECLKTNGIDPSFGTNPNNWVTGVKN